MAFAAKTNWKAGDEYPATDMNRLEQGVADATAAAEGAASATALSELEQRVAELEQLATEAE